MASGGTGRVDAQSRKKHSTAARIGQEHAKDVLNNPWKRVLDLFVGPSTPHCSNYNPLQTFAELHPSNPGDGAPNTEECGTLDDPRDTGDLIDEGPEESNGRRVKWTCQG